MIEVRIYENRLGDGSGAELIARLTDAVVETYGPEIRDQTWVVLTPVPTRLWGIGGRPGA